jgi:4-diphosphocytidyl-2-C-methyl-D-erythritol kinase
MITLTAPAKVNLTLEVIARRDDGFHEIKSIIQTISLADIVTMENSRETEFSTNSSVWNAGQSLVAKTVALFRETTGTDSGVSLHVEKRIPMSAGLGGDSSDAAAVLKGLNALRETGLSRDELHRMAEQLGSDVPFFLYGGTALMEGRGEIITPLPSVPLMHLVLVVPDIVPLTGKTGKLYAGLKEDDFTDGAVTRRWVSALEREKTLPDIDNVFENVARRLFPGLQEVYDTVTGLTSRKVHLAGSGPVMFVKAQDRLEAESLSVRLIENGLKAVVTETASPSSGGQ